ncbi:hypothetical protein, partial [Mesorhizobium sp.]|uniref:hypothetical protein n=1 Tax=Mesorhizobium sp. TaxID=1871066 RepID=UPI0025C1DDBB
AAAATAANIALIIRSARLSVRHHQDQIALAHHADGGKRAVMRQRGGCGIERGLAAVSRRDLG